MEKQRQREERPRVRAQREIIDTNKAADKLLHDALDKLILHTAYQNRLSAIL